ncbi:MarR family transcriptional regulator [Nocardia sp. 852002-20019_SCH5090214]|uniref:MarR family transcriptional regulator n=1 Tax=Nocardia nova TaxID=37330 RepID=A0A2S6A183_9NOCA|nr:MULTISPECIES: MarR family transcriptional regulator [Nocardia]OBF78003.1 MarR family transcriptional regulator [Mycobacterium sp. 852002-51759_SCH5129042]MBV7702790.1 MarR family transcriptional regulator [Nocardia nova]OBA40909.1 MarR family transcriptional regulator [Nocardia sp. 852002-51101_SCH5132738]OBA42514.1 MarR family transcriptional regulator [Nocardia sp. 852002-20019_SCH5090214]OBB39249.1 MarR family transcriptional regulator [Nocardia sp. 852002-51244_SCH5132740]
MPRSEGSPESVVDADYIVELERALTRIAHLLTRARRHDRTVAAAGVNLDRANVPLLRMLADAAEPMRMGELAACLDVEAPHVTRQIQRLERAGYVDRVTDPEDRRAQRVRITDEGRATVDAIRAVSRRHMRDALADWSTEDLRQLAALNHRMVDAFLDSAERTDAWRR